jgi:hypothetical protein
MCDAANFAEKSLLPLAMSIVDWSNYVMQISTSLQTRKLQALSGQALLPRRDTKMPCYLHEGVQVSNQIAYDENSKSWRMFEYDKTTEEQFEIARLQTSNLPKANMIWQLHEGADKKEVLVVHLWSRQDWDDKQTKLTEDHSTEAAILFKEKLAEVETKLEKSKEAASHETSELRLVAKETEAMVENMKADFARDLKDVNIRIGEVTFATGTLKKRQLATDEETKFLREAQADSATQIFNLKKEVSELREATSRQHCRCGSSSLLRKLNAKMDRDIGKGDRILVDFGSKLEEMDFERPDIIRGKRGIHASRKGGRTTFVRWEDVFVQEKCYECRSKRQKRH